MSGEASPLEEVARRIVDWWLDVESLAWDRENAVIRAPIEEAETRVKLGIGSSKAPAVFGHELVIHRVIDLVVRHDGGYPFAQPVEALWFDAARSEVTVEMGFGSSLTVRVEAPEIEVVALDSP